jgi:ribosomal protein S18 acetylase RimI-like enzyme
MLTRAYPAVRSAAADRPGDASRRARRVAGTTRVSGGRLTERSRPARISSTRFARRRAVRPRSGDPGSRDPSRWRVRQVYGDGKVLLDQLREVADLLAEGFDASGRSSKDLLNGLVQKVRWSGGDFVCLVADDGADGSAMVGACDLTLLPAGGPKRSREGLVADVPAQLALDPDADHFLYLTGMVVPGRMRRRGVGRALLAQSERLAAKMRPRPRCVALHVSKKNDAARGLYERAGYASVEDLADGAGGGEGAARDDGGLLASFPLAYPAGGLLGGMGKKPASRDEALMVKWLEEDEGASGGGASEASEDDARE